MKFFKEYKSFLNEAKGENKIERAKKILAKAQENITNNNFDEAARQVNKILRYLDKVVSKKLNKNVGSDYDMIKNELVAIWNATSPILNRLEEVINDSNTDRDTAEKIKNIIHDQLDEQRLSNIKREVEEKQNTENKNEPEKEIVEDTPIQGNNEISLVQLDDNKKKELLQLANNISIEGTNTKNVNQKKNIQTLINGLTNANIDVDGKIGTESQTAILKLKSLLAEKSELQDLVNSDVNPQTKGWDGFMRSGLRNAIIKYLGGTPSNVSIATDIFSMLKNIYSNGHITQKGGWYVKDGLHKGYTFYSNGTYINNTDLKTGKYNVKNNQVFLTPNIVKTTTSTISTPQTSKQQSKRIAELFSMAFNDEDLEKMAKDPEGKIRDNDTYQDIFGYYRYYAIDTFTNFNEDAWLEIFRKMSSEDLFYFISEYNNKPHYYDGSMVNFDFVADSQEAFDDSEISNLSDILQSKGIKVEGKKVTKNNNAWGGGKSVGNGAGSTY